jgi:hypothetical protein
MVIVAYMREYSRTSCVWAVLTSQSLGACLSPSRMVSAGRTGNQTKSSQSTWATWCDHPYSHDIVVSDAQARMELHYVTKERVTVTLEHRFSCEHLGTNGLRT